MSEYVLLNLHNGNEIASSTISGIVDEIIPAHATVAQDSDEAGVRLMMRHVFLASVANRAQAIAVAAMAEMYPDSLTDADEDILTLILHDRIEEIVVFEKWDSDVPLFLMASAYAPYTATPRPAGTRIVFLDAINERSFVDSLQAAGYAELYIKEEDEEIVDQEDTPVPS